MLKKWSVVIILAVVERHLSEALEVVRRRAVDGDDAEDGNMKAIAAVHRYLRKASDHVDGLRSACSTTGSVVSVAPELAVIAQGAERLVQPVDDAIAATLAGDDLPPKTSRVAVRVADAVAEAAATVDGLAPVTRAFRLAADGFADPAHLTADQHRALERLRRLSLLVLTRLGQASAVLENAEVIGALTRSAVRVADFADRHLEPALRTSAALRDGEEVSDSELEEFAITLAQLRTLVRVARTVTQKAA
jgi:hypothetical protein